MQTKYKMLIPEENDNSSEDFGPYENKKSTLEKQDIKGNYRNSIGKSLDIWSHIKDGLSGLIPQAWLIGSESLSLLKEVRFND